ncbi:conserved hypothetical protein [Streptomyces himastatinicus ATCC 53653]|uniref:Metallo-beta-lactamase domain-containing protein n=1 Tax=Streptomyces himastatinicus ATCC 53653 TaxID=457427 RepID=D9WH00_9ACTN|nr:conserved hypothetical protein [Streptomyces himastatinicus ATCC 53653]
MTPPPDGAADFLFVGNATLLIRYGTLTLLTDPNFRHRGQYVYLGKGLVSRRLTESALAVEDIPSDLDAVVLSHLHGTTGIVWPVVGWTVHCPPSPLLTPPGDTGSAGRYPDATGSRSSPSPPAPCLPGTAGSSPRNGTTPRGDAQNGHPPRQRSRNSSRGWRGRIPRGGRRLTESRVRRPTLGALVPLATLPETLRSE